MQIAEVSCFVDSDGTLVIPISVLEEMELGPGDTVQVSYLTDLSAKGDLELLLSRKGLEQTYGDDTVALPNHLLQEANMPDDGNIEIACLDGAIVFYHADSEDSLEDYLEALNIIAGSLK